MLLIIIPLVVGLVASHHVARPEDPARIDFNEIASATGYKVGVIDTDDAEHLGKLLAADSGELRLKLPSGVTTITKDRVRAAWKVGDQPFDGMGVGAVVGYLLSLLLSEGCDNEHCLRTLWLSSAATGAAIGFAIDRAHEEWKPLYKAPTPKAQVQVLRIRF